MIYIEVLNFSFHISMGQLVYPTLETTTKVLCASPTATDPSPSDAPGNPGNSMVGWKPLDFPAVQKLESKCLAQQGPAGGLEDPTPALWLEFVLLGWCSVIFRKNCVGCLTI